MSRKTIRRSLTMTQEMHDRLVLLVIKHPRDTTEADLIREAIRAYLDNQADIIGSRKHFQKSLQDRLDKLETTLAFQLNVLIYLVSALDPQRLTEAILATPQDGDKLLTQMKAIRELKNK
jgi:uncharacterized coiled-coil protein SlyX